VNWQTGQLGDRWAAVEPIRQGMHHAFGRFGKGRRAGLGHSLRLGLITRDNMGWLIERVGHRTPVQARVDGSRRAAA